MSDLQVPFASCQRKRNPRDMELSRSWSSPLPRDFPITTTSIKKTDENVFDAFGIQPGWPELVGTGFEKAIEMITVEQIGVKVVYGPDGFGRDKMFDLRRVFLDIDSHGNVARIPGLG
ncbi:hypothetical protein R1flu_028878 [Riccia fluitans]|uniref:Uncharacterized protein n=1 Tax=Riccia fluitans TaxID=41844 RepID=A0ABD1XN03_9MARC